jgi:hypothetical protein
MDRAAQNLSEAAGQLQSQNADAKQAAAAGAPGESEQGAGGGGTRVTLDLSDLETELERLSGRQWGRLPGHLRTAILESATLPFDPDYADLISRYFETIAAPPTPSESEE